MGIAEDIKKEIDMAVDEALSSTFLDQLAGDIVDQIRRRTRLGFGVDASGNQVPLKQLEKSTIDSRRRNSRRLSPFTRPKRSNLTATGQLLNAIRGASAENTIQISFDEFRGRDLTGAGSSNTNSQIAGFVSKLRPFFKISNAEFVEIERKITDRVNRLIDNV